MKAEVAIKIIQAGIGKKEIIHILSNENSEASVFDAAFSTGLFSKKEIMSYAHSQGLWIIALPHILSKLSSEEKISILKKESKGHSGGDFSIMIDALFNFWKLPNKEAIEIATTISRSIPGGKMVWYRVTHPGRITTFTKKELLFLGQQVHGSLLLLRIFEGLLKKRATKKEIARLQANPYCGKKFLITLLENGICKRKDVMTLLEKSIDRSMGGASYAEQFQKIFGVYSFSLKEVLKFARKVKYQTVWEALQYSFDNYLDFLSEQEVIYLLHHGWHKDKAKIINRLSSKKLIKIALGSEKKSKEEVSAYTIMDIIRLGKLDKQTVLQIARKANWYDCWKALIKSKVFSDDEILNIVEKEGIGEGGHSKYIWEAICETIDLSHYTFERLIEMGNRADSESAWTKIVLALQKRNL